MCRKLLCLCSSVIANRSDAFFVNNSWKHPWPLVLNVYQKKLRSFSLSLNLENQQKPHFCSDCSDPFLIANFCSLSTYIREKSIVYNKNRYKHCLLSKNFCGPVCTRRPMRRVHDHIWLWQLREKEAIKENDGGDKDDKNVEYCLSQTQKRNKKTDTWKNKWRRVTISLRTGGQGHPTPIHTPSHP